MHIQNLVKIYKCVLKILNRNETLMDGQIDGHNGGLSKSRIAPFFKAIKFQPSMLIQNLVKSYQFVLKTLSGNEGGPTFSMDVLRFLMVRDHC